MVKKTLSMLLLLGMLVTAAVSLQSTPALEQASVASAATYGTWAPPWNPDWNTDWWDWYQRNYYGYGYWNYGGGYDYAQSRRSAATAAPQYGRGSYGGITYSTEILKQVWMNGRSLQFRVFGDNERSTFKLSFGPSTSGGTRMVLTVQRRHNEVLPAYDAAALNFLEDNGVDEVVIIKSTGEETTYTIEQLRNMLG